MTTSKQLQRKISKLEKKLSNSGISVATFAKLDGQIRALKSQLQSQSNFEKDPKSYMRKFLK